MERVRSKGGDYGSSLIQMYTVTHHDGESYPDPDPAATNGGMRSLGSWSTVTTDVETDHFLSRRDKGEIINNPFKTITTKEIKPIPQPFSHEWKIQHTPTSATFYKQGGVWWGPNGCPVLEISSEIRQSRRQSVIDLAVTQAQANINVSEMMALATVAESRKSVDSVRAILFRAYKIFRNVRRLNVKALREELSPSELADRYMEARYAIRPLVYDLQGVRNALEKERGLIRRSFTGQADDSYSLTDILVSQPNGLYNTSTDFTRKVDYRVSARAGVLCDVNVTAMNTYGADQILETAWELLPFSFIVDWFTNVGNFIAAHSPNAGVRQLASWVTVKETLITTQTGSSSQSEAASLPSGIPISIDLPATTFRQEELVLERIIDPALSVFPQVNLNLDMFKITDLGIILSRILQK